MKLQLLTKENFFKTLRDHPWQENYLAMYSSQWGRATTDPPLMMIPMDDHLVHRGDGVFDVMRCVRGNIYQMEAHLERLERSAKAISLHTPPEYEQIRDLIKALVVLGGERECTIRVVLSRGPGSFSTSPADCPVSHLYINIVRFKAPPDKYYRDGIPIITSKIPVKKSFFANIKSCNYLPNVLMKLEAIEAGCQYAVNLDEDGFLAEGSTENIAVLTHDGYLKFPGFERTLSGVTAGRVAQLAEKLVQTKMISKVEFAKITPEEAYKSKEMFFTGTSLNLLPVISFDGKPIGNGSPGSVYTKLSSLLWEDMTQNQELLTPLDWKRVK
jgi:branched-subunit amino acid aminotransferase/4-amino-4-deoxychorismate lyase